MAYSYSFTDWVDATMLTRVRSMLNEPTALQFTDVELTGWIDRGANIALKDTKGKRNIVNFNATSGTAEYSLASIGISESSTITIDTVFYTGVTESTLPTPQTVSGGYCLQKIHPRQILKSPHAALSAPRLWYERGITSGSAATTTGLRYIGISPTPVNTAGGGNDAYLLGYVVLYYENELWFDNTINLLPNHMQEAVTWYVLAQANIKLKRYSVANMFMSIFTNYLMFYRQDYLPKPVDSLDMMHAPDFTQIA